MTNFVIQNLITLISCELTFIDQMNAVEDYFNKIVWSIEKEEWNKYTNTEKEEIVKNIIKSCCL